MNRGLNRGFSGGSVALNIEKKAEKAVFNPAYGQTQALSVTYDPLPLHEASVFAIPGAGQRIFGIEAGMHGQIIWILNSNNQTNIGVNSQISINNASAAHHPYSIMTPDSQTVMLLSGQAAMLIYDETAVFNTLWDKGAWRLISANMTAMGSFGGNSSVPISVGSSGSLTVTGGTTVGISIGGDAGTPGKSLQSRADNASVVTWQAMPGETIGRLRQFR